MKGIDRIVNLLKQAKTFYIATSADNQPSVRPFNAVVKHNGKIYLYTNSRTSAYKQISENPFVGICTMVAEDRWLKLTGTAIFDASSGAKKAMLDANPSLRKMYNENDKIFEVFYLDKLTAKLHSNYDSPEVICTSK